MTGNEWRDEANCRGYARPDEFFALDTSVLRKLKKKFCDDCPVVEECLADAVSRREQYGMWGGLLLGERRRYHKRG